jgi:L-threonylcarbamoyladenylate synthase
MIIARNNPTAVTTAVKILGSGGVAILPCDTIYGIVGIAPDTEKRIRTIKGRGDGKPFLMLIAAPEWIMPYSQASLPAALESYWPGPLTILFPNRHTSGKTALRMPNDDFLLKILKLIQKPVYSTSVNVSGGVFLREIDEIVREFEQKVELVIDAGDLPETLPSTIVDISTRPFTVVRQGSLVIPEHVLSGD